MNSQNKSRFGKLLGQVVAICGVAAVALNVPMTGVAQAQHEGQTAAGKTGQMSETAARTKKELQAGMDRLFFLKAAQGNGAEVMTGRLALTRANSPRVRELAELLIREHSMANSDLSALATRRNMPFPREIGAKHTAMHDQLSRLSGSAFDQMFMAGQMEAHEDTITLYQQELAMGRDGDMKAYVNKYLPRVLTHTAMIYEIAREVKAPGVAERPQGLTNMGLTMNQMMQDMNHMGGH